MVRFNVERVANRPLGEFRPLRTSLTVNHFVAIPGGAHFTNTHWDCYLRALGYGCPVQFKRDDGCCLLGLLPNSRKETIRLSQWPYLQCDNKPRRLILRILHHRLQQALRMKPVLRVLLNKMPVIGPCFLCLYFPYWFASEIPKHINFSLNRLTNEYRPPLRARPGGFHLMNLMLCRHDFSSISSRSSIADCN